jgi:glycosyltransferase involved in cell wall biosynthesis
LLKILILYWPIADYTIACIDELCKKGHEVVLVRYPASQDAPFKEVFPTNLTVFDRKKFHKGELLRFATDFNPDVTYISGWVDKEYLQIGKWCKKLSKPVIMALDNPWEGTLRQFLGLVLFRISYSKSFTHAFVAGYRQYEFARKLGYEYSDIIFNMYAARTSNFDNTSIEARFCNGNPKKTLLYVGRLIPYKGIMELYSAFLEIEQELGASLNWHLEIYGNGLLRDKLLESNNIKVFEFIQPSDIPEVLNRTHAFCLPSYSESWGVSVHEFAAAGLALLISDGVSAREQFVINNFNGIVFKKAEIKNALLKLFSLKDDELLKMGKNSRILSQKISPGTWASTFLSVLK